MKESIKYHQPDHTCDCENRHLLEYQKVCNICGGKVRNQENTLEEILPESRFDPEYFTELEAFYYGE